MPDHKNATDWFEKLYASADLDAGKIPWASEKPNIHLFGWQAREKRDGTGKTALVIGCGLGDDAEYIAEWGYSVTAFDISETAINWCKQRWTDTSVDYRVADLFNLPQDFQRKFDFVYESYTLQALPFDLHEQAIQAVANTVSDELLLVCRARDDDESPGMQVPLMLSPAELAQFEQHGLTVMVFEDFVDMSPRFAPYGLRRYRVLFKRDGVV